MGEVRAFTNSLPAQALTSTHPRRHSDSRPGERQGNETSVDERYIETELQHFDTAVPGAVPRRIRLGSAWPRAHKRRSAEGVARSRE